LPQSFGFSEAFAVDRWVSGDGDDRDLEAHLGSFPFPRELRDTFRWQRAYNRRAERTVGFAGIDLPRAGGSLRPSLEHVADFLSQYDPEAMPLCRRAMRLAASFEGDSMAEAAPRHARLPQPHKDELTASLSRLSHRLDALAPQHLELAGSARLGAARQHVRSACHTDYNLHATAGFLSGGGLSGDMSARDRFMASSVLWHLERGGPDTKVVLVAHNAHIQKAPVVHGDVLSAYPLGQHLAAELGAGYVAVGVTSVGGTTAGLIRDESAPRGFRIEATALEAPRDGSVEAAFVAAKRDFAFVDLLHATGSTGSAERIRLDTDYLEAPITRAFDGLFCLPMSTVADDM
jgi:erythromycin esterase